MAVGVGATQSGVLTDESKTATEVQAVQANSNIRQLLNNKLDELGEQQYWTGWYNMYVEYFSEKDEKVVRIL